MCRGTKTCTELGTRPELWSREAPLVPPVWFESQLSIFVEAAKAAAGGDVFAARAKLLLIRSTDLQTWYIEHGQNSGTFRHRQLGKRKAQIFHTSLDTLASSDRFSNEVFKRDGYRCRYCGLRLIPKSVLQAFSAVVGADAFRATGTNVERHGIVLAFRANADHVVPYNLGGRTDLNNLVACCWSCNYGKGKFTLDQLGLEDPRNRPVNSANTWDGLTSFF